MIKKIKFLTTAVYHRLISKNKLAKILGVEFGENCNFMTRAWGSEPYLIHMGNSVRISSHVTFVTHNSLTIIGNLYPEYEKADFFGKITIGNNVFIGINSTLLPNTRIGDNVIIGAGSLVKGELKSNSVYAGVPVRYICSLDEYIEKTKDSYDYTRHFDPKSKKEYLLKKYNIKKVE